jgi:hypothetical protein
MIFNPYHSFTYIDAFLATFNIIRANHATSVRALAIPQYCNSVRTKLHSSKTHLENILAIKKWGISQSNTYNSNLTSIATNIATSNPSNYTTSGMTINTSSVINQQVPSVRAMNLSRDLDGFFECIVSALDIFAHIINLTYFNRPKSAGSVSFDYILDKMIGTPNLSNEPITQQLASIRNANWYKEMKPYRRCAIHYGSINYQILYKSTFQPLVGTYSSSDDVDAILLADNPLGLVSTFNKKRKVNTFCKKIEKRELDSLDIAFNIAENDISLASRIPI